jgi:hypothetical protein
MVKLERFGAVLSMIPPSRAWRDCMDEPPSSPEVRESPEFMARSEDQHREEEDQDRFAHRNADL